MNATIQIYSLRTQDSRNEISIPNMNNVGHSDTLHSSVIANACKEVMTASIKPQPPEKHKNHNWIYI